MRLFVCCVLLAACAPDADLCVEDASVIWASDVESCVDETCLDAADADYADALEACDAAAPSADGALARKRPGR